MVQIIVTTISGCTVAYFSWWLDHRK
ncbi:type I toxin-antitoxin system Fst family toxin [Lactobacillus sp. W8089]|nr:type I toxin-antitoxin system Fst family toxin [Lactobacillus sp. W8086]MBI0109538.1 type I toxin-antitoxin system Fst family toxin [Lactobacillus sp. W8085]MBI0112738.1 type I toxin-antitoxin system Fst family toxin [Lactobacillus sp. W8088]MBI0116470.1 type I toxin-antitoxin system Fst family toxin [Lactobacillus sp. W8087]MBI0120180.1 type I toxin-antitoxin system Fst family toxin [Lactobacillus sp. W8089]MBI0132160.1 type I toxin-antitoxin system Fst family toxin [Lactobacillus sp. W809